MTLRAVFFEADDARAVADRLARDGFEAALVRERFAGEDDDEDHPWAVVTDAPEVLVELLVEERDGWLDRPGDVLPPPLDGPRDGPHEAPGDVPRRPLDLPDGPRRIKGHFRRD